MAKDVSKIEARAAELRSLIAANQAKIDTSKIEELADFDSFAEYLDFCGIHELTEIAEANGLISTPSAAEVTEKLAQDRRDLAWQNGFTTKRHVEY